MLNKEKMVLICDNSAQKERLKDILSETGCTIQSSDNLEEAIERLRFTYYDAIFIDEGFDSEGKVLNYLQEMPMNLRRNIFVVLLSDELKTDKNLIAFSKSVNLILNRDDIEDLLEILKKSIHENDRFYMVYKETLTKIGKK